jgi:hypothetical protein
MADQKPPQDIAAIIAESTAQLDAMIAANLAADKAFVSRNFRSYLTEHIRSVKEALGMLDGDEPDTADPGNVAGQSETEMGEGQNR